MADTEDGEKDLLAAVIRTGLDDYSVDKNDAEKLAEKIVRLGWRKQTNSAFATLEGRVAKLEAWASGRAVKWDNE